MIAGHSFSVILPSLTVSQIFGSFQLSLSPYLFFFFFAVKVVPKMSYVFATGFFWRLFPFRPFLVVKTVLKNAVLFRTFFHAA